MTANERLRLGLALGLLSAGAVWAGCSVYDASLLTTKSLPVTDAGPADTCAHVRWPERPAGDTTGDVDAESGDFVVALRRISVNGASDGGVKPQGADLDGVCTCTTGPSDCTRPAVAKSDCDDDAGADDSTATLFTDLQKQAGPIAEKLFSDDGFNEGLAAGTYGILVRVEQYNGLADDAQVKVTFYPSNGTVDSAGASMKPRWDGTDLWSLDPSGFIGSGTVTGSTNGLPAYVDIDAYVAGSVLVSHVTFPLALSGAGSGYLNVKLSDGMLYTPIVKDPNGFRAVGGQIVGRWATRDLLTSLAVYPDPTAPGAYLCKTDSFYQGLKKSICQYADIKAKAAEDDTTPPTACDAISFAVGFEAQPAASGPIVTRPAQDGGCGADWTDDCSQ